jgi:nucleotide-binding universal stress UspA family protein
MNASSPTIVLGYEDCPAGAAAFTVATDLVRRLNGSLHVVHALAQLDLGTLSAVSGAPIALPDSLDTEARERMESERRSMLEEVVAAGGVPHTLVVESAHPATLIAREAEKVGAYLVVVGASASGFGAALDRALGGGSTAHALEKEVRHHSRWPLLIVPAPEGQD